MREADRGVAEKTETLRRAADGTQPSRGRRYAYPSRARQERRIVTSASREGHARQAQGAAEQGEHRAHFPEDRPPHEYRERRHEVGGRPHPARGRPSERVRPRREGHGRRERAEVDGPAYGRGVGFAQLAQQRRGEWQASDRPNATREPRHLHSRDAREHRFLGDHASGVAERRNQAEHRAEASLEAAPGGDEPYHHDPREGDGAAGEERAGEALAQQGAREDRDKDGAYAHEHGRGTCVHQPLGGVERDVVEPEPQHPAQGDGREVPPRREPLPTDQDERAERGAADQQPRQRQGAGGKGRARRPYTHARGGPAASAASDGAPGERASPAARIPTNAEAHRTTDTSAAPHASRGPLRSTPFDGLSIKNAPLLSYPPPPGRDRLLETCGPRRSRGDRGDAQDGLQGDDARARPGEHRGSSPAVRGETAPLGRATNPLPIRSHVGVTDTGRAQGQL